MDKQKILEDLVPPLELCKAAREVIGEKTALVWRICKDGSTEVVQRDWLSRNWKNPEELFVFPAPPAPTLAELLEMLPENVSNNELFDDVGWLSTKRLYPSLSDPVYWIGYSYYGLIDNRSCKIGEGDAMFDANPATAALRLLMKVKGVTE